MRKTAPPRDSLKSAAEMRNGELKRAPYLELTSSRQGAWIINASKHLLRYESTHPSLDSLENILFAGKGGALLIKLSADEPEQLTRERVKVHAGACGIRSYELPLYLNALRALGCIDWDEANTTYEVLAFSRARVLETTSRILAGSLSGSGIEEALLEALEFCLRRPRLGSELREYLSASLSEEDVEYLLSLIKEFELLGSTVVPGRSEELYFNRYQFGNRAVDIGKAIAGFSEQDREYLDVLLEEVARSPGVQPGNVKVPDEVKLMAIGLGRSLRSLKFSGDCKVPYCPSSSTAFCRSGNLTPRRRCLPPLEDAALLTPLWRVQILTI